MRRIWLLAWILLVGVCWQLSLSKATRLLSEDELPPVAQVDAVQARSTIFEAPGGDDPGMSIPTLSVGKPADRNEQTVFDTNAGCTRLYQSNYSRVVRVLTRRTILDKFEERGTGFFVTGSGLVAMCEHELIDCKAGIRILAWNSKMYTADVVMEDKPNDICILSIRDRHVGPFQAVQLGSEAGIAYDADMLALGYPCGWDQFSMSAGSYVLTCQGGLVFDGSNRPVTCIDPHRPVLAARMHCEPGNSGSPVLDGHGCVIGMVEAVSHDRYDTFITPVSTLVDDLKELGVSSPDTQPRDL